ncbi:MAG: hypothetical protein PVI90_13410 [Desulfobacteraceae bacterium]|jgi:hypothetical protein
MPIQLEIPSTLRGAFQRVIRHIPYDLRNDEQIFRTTLAYLCLGGEKLARQGIEVAKEQRKQELNRLKKIRRQEAMLNSISESDEDEDLDEVEDNEFDRDDDLDSSDY